MKDVVHFYNTRDVASEGWDVAEVPATESLEELGHRNDRCREDDLICFLRTLTDGYQTRRAASARIR